MQAMIMWHLSNEVWRTSSALVYACKFLVANGWRPLCSLTCRKTGRRSLLSLLPRYE